MADKGIDGLRKRRSKLIRHTHLCEKYKSLIVRKVKDLNYLYDNNEITYGEYKAGIDNVLQNKTVREWTNYYDGLIVEYETKIKEITVKIRESEKQRKAVKNNSITVSVITLILIMVGLFTYFNMPGKIIGMTTTDTVANVTVANVPPNVTDVNITPSVPNTTSNLTCQGTTSDKNLDTVSVYYKWYIDDILNTPLYNLNNVTSGNTTKGQSWICEITPFDGIVNGTPVNSSAVTIGNIAPNLTLAELYPATPYTTDNLTLNVTCTDIDNTDTLSAYWHVYRNDTLLTSLNGSQITLNGTEANITVVNSTNTTKHENWTVEVWCGDETANTTKQNTSTRIIQNTAPTVPTQITPTNGNNTLFDRNVSFNWSDSTDADNDAITYQLNVTNAVYPNVFKSDIDISNYTLKQHLEVDSWYNWTLRAYDGESYSSWATIWNFTIPSSVRIDLTANETGFGTLSNNENRNTTSGDATPFTVENMGNVITDIKLTPSTRLWTSVAINTSYFQFMANTSTEANSFNWSGSQTSWYNVTNTSILVIDKLKYNYTNDVAEVEFLVRVPPLEQPGIKSSIIIVTGVMS